MEVSIDNFVVDHKSRNRKDNRKANLRIANNSENGMNKGIRTNNTSGKVGVHWSKSQEKWCAMIGYNHVHKNLGYFNNYDDAVLERIKAEDKYFKEFKTVNERVIKNAN